MIDPESGALVLTEGRIAPSLTRAAFRKGAFAAGSDENDVKTGWRDYTLKKRKIGARPVSVTLSFAGERLRGYSLVDVSARFPSGWDDWSEKGEQARRAAHDKWLAEMLGPPQRRDDAHFSKSYTLPWGTVSSSFDPRSGGSSIDVHFRK